MKKDFIYNIESEDNITKQIIYANSTFNINDVFTDEKNHQHTSITIITPSQNVNCEFNYRLSPGGHAGITDIILSRIYPEYEGTNLFSDQEIYAKNAKNNIFILTIKTFLIIFIPEVINQTQYDYLYSFIDNFKKTGYYRLGREIDLYVNDENYPFKKIDDILQNLKGKITTIKIPEQYIFPKLDLSNIQSDEEMVELIDENFNTYCNNRKAKK